MKLKWTYTFTFFISIISIYGNAQTILNGDFENHSLDSCFVNAVNIDFNSAVENVYAFGSNEEVDLFTDSCILHPTISNHWFASLSFSPTGKFDQIALELEQPLEEGLMYQLSYYERADTSSNPVFDNLNVPLEIGVAEAAFSFGDSIFSSIPEPDVWTMRTFEFTAPNNGRFITVRIVGVLGDKAWNLVDNFQLSLWTPTFETENLQTNIYPNPVRDWVNVETDVAIKSIRIFNAIGQEMIFLQNVNPYFNKLELGHLAAGIYFMEIATEKTKVVERIKIM